MRITGTGLGVLATSLVLGCCAVLLAAPALGLAAVAGLLALASGVLSTITAARPTAVLSLDTATVRRGGLVTARIRFAPTRLLLRTGVDLGSTAFGLSAVPAVPAAVGPSETASGPERILVLGATRHGAMTVGPPVLTQTDPLGLCRRVTRTSGTSALLVRPALLPVGRVRPPGRARSSVGGRAPRPTGASRTPCARTSPETTSG